MRWMVANVSQTPMWIHCTYISLDTTHHNVKVVYLRRESYCMWKNQQWRKPAETDRNMWERVEEKSSGSHRKSAEKFICFVPIYDVVKRKLEFPFYVYFKSSCHQLCENISMIKNDVDPTIIWQRWSITKHC